MASHFGPPTAPSNTASAARARSRVSSANGTPCLSMAAPPITSWLNSKPRANLSLASSSTLTASAMISGPIPSPGRIRICLLMLSSCHQSVRPWTHPEKFYRSAISTSTSVLNEPSASISKYSRTSLPIDCCNSRIAARITSGVRMRSTQLLYSRRKR
ncbi:hypothetical protein D3C85_1474400 [compost metagenome]